MFFAIKLPLSWFQRERNDKTSKIENEDITIHMINLCSVSGSRSEDTAETVKNELSIVDEGRFIFNLALHV